MKLLQWAVIDDSDCRAYFFTPLKCDKETALAIGRATHGEFITEVENEGEITQAMPVDEDDPYPDRIWPEAEMN